MLDAVQKGTTLLMLQNAECSLQNKQECLLCETNKIYLEFCHHRESFTDRTRRQSPFLLKNNLTAVCICEGNISSQEAWYVYQTNA